MTKIVSSHPIAFASAPNGHCFLSLHTVMYENKNGDKRPYFMCTRGDAPSDSKHKLPEAVVILGIKIDGDEPELVMTKEFRVPIGTHELGFPAGLIDPLDYDQIGDSLGYNPEQDFVTKRNAAFTAAIREFKEETGLTFEPKEMSPPNLYSSAGMTDESVCVVMGIATGTISTEHQEASEDIETITVKQSELNDLLHKQTTAHSKVAWPFLWAFNNWGFPTFDSKVGL